MTRRTNTNSFTTYLEGRRFTIKVSKTEYFDGRGSKTKVFVWGTPSPEELGQTAERPAYTTKGEDPVSDAAWKAYNKLEMANMRHFAEAAVAGKLGFSAKAGCSCPCSPGFIVKDRRDGFDVSYSVEVVG